MLRSSSSAPPADPAKGGQPVHARAILLALVLFESPRPLVLGPSRQLRPLPGVLVQRHAKAADVSDALDGDANDRTNPGRRRREEAAELVEVRDPAARSRHHGHARGRCWAAPRRRTTSGRCGRSVEDGQWFRCRCPRSPGRPAYGGRDTQRVESFGRDVQMPGRIERRGRDEEHLLGFDERANACRR